MSGLSGPLRGMGLPTASMRIVMARVAGLVCHKFGSTILRRSRVDFDLIGAVVRRVAGETAVYFALDATGTA